MSPSAAAAVLFRTTHRARTLAAVVVIVVAALAAYQNSFRAPFLFDDGPAILENPSIRQLWPPWGIFSLRETGLTVSGRPAANLSLAINYALSGTNVWSYHALNLLIHILSGLTLFGVVRRTLQRPVLHGRFDRDALPLALVIALLWTLHPLQTEAVTYVIQRVESLMGLFYLLTLYGFVRAVESPRPCRWQVCTIAACLLGMATKKVMATAPLLVLLYDRTFVAGSLREALGRRRWLHLSLAATWVPLVWLVAATGWNRGGTAGLDAGAAPWGYWLTQFEAVARYLWLSVWPYPLVFEYGTFWVHDCGEVVPYAFVVVLLAAATLAALRRWPVWGFLGAWYFVILAPTSVVPGAIQMIVEHRMYLPLAAVMTLAVLAIHAAVRRQSWVMFAGLALGLGILTAQRNENYRSELTIWSETVAKRPNNARAHNNLGLALDRAGQSPKAILQYSEALRLQPDLVEAHNNLGNILDRTGRTSEAIQQYEAALQINPNYAEAHNNLGNILDRTGRTPEAIQHFETALRIQPDSVDAHNDLGNVLFRIRQTAEAIQQYETALKFKPDYAKAHYNLGVALDQVGRTPEAIRHYEEALRLQPDLVEAHNNLGVALCRSGRLQEAIAHFREALQLRRDFAEAHENLGNALLQIGRMDEAIIEYDEVLRLRPDDAVARRSLDLIQARLQTGGSAP
jgi:Flp pilus assembly protein TadD